MKTQKTNLNKKLKATLFIVIFFTVTLVGSTQDSCLLTFDKDMNLKISDDVLAMVDIPEIEEIYINPRANLYIIEFEETDEYLEIEEWMTKESFSSTNVNFEWEITDREDDLEIEEWMYKEKSFEDEESELEIEKWMTESWSK